ncbi:MAG: DUF4392 domain-containing protein [Roseburia sp.]|nr:DUF4392 domain-containing protein [Roseburia sp.]MCM1278347.1 DUF4392 domain-containing protein [Robinsoniella sp.]
MTKKELAILQMGENLDVLMNLDPRGYGVCRILYEGSRAYTGGPLTINAADKLISAVGKGDFVYIITGFILMPHKAPEMDGMVSSMLLARSLVQAFDAKPVIICPADCNPAVEKCAHVVGLHLYENLTDVERLPFSMGIIPFTKDMSFAEKQAEQIISQNKLPAAVISIEAPGANHMGEYHNATGNNLTRLEAKTDILFCRLKEKGVLNIAIGDLGNEIGMGAIADHIKRYIPYADDKQCRCTCQGGILAASKADHIITATVSDWGCYGLMAALAYLKKDLSIFHNGRMEAKVMEAAAGSGLVDMDGSLVPGIDGFSVRMNVDVVRLMRDCVRFGIESEGRYGEWFDEVLGKGFY